MADAGSTERESLFDAMAADLGIVIPIDWRDGVSAGVAELGRMGKLIAASVMETSEPANVFDVGGLADADTEELGN